MSQRDTLNPVCRVVNVAANATAVVTLRRTANAVTLISTLGNSDGSGYTDYAEFIVSGVPQAGWGTDKTANQASAQIGVSAAGIIRSGVGGGDYTGVPSAIHITSAGAFGTISGTLGLSSLHSQNAAGVPGSVAGHVSGATFTIILGPPTYAPTYVTVTDASGADAGFFRVQPGSGQGYYLSGDGNMGHLSRLTTSGVPGVVGAAGDTITLTLQESLTTTDIIIENRLTKSNALAGSAFLITYGAMKQASTIRDQQKPDVV